MAAFRRKSNSDDFEYDGKNPRQVYHLLDGPRFATNIDTYRQTGKYREPGVVRYEGCLGLEASGRHLSDIAIDIEWEDIIDMIKFLANNERLPYPPARALLRLQEALEAAVEKLQKEEMKQVV